MSHTPLEHLEPCRCLVKITEMGSQILYCPLHAAAPALLEALKEIAEGKGQFSQDHLTHAKNTIEDMKMLATIAIALAEGRG